MTTNSTRVRTAIVTGLAAASLALTGCNQVSPGEGGGEQQEQQENGGGEEEDD